MDRWKAEQGRGREKRKIRRKKSKKKEDADAWKGRKVAKHCVFPMIWGSGGSKSRLAKAAGAEPAGQMRREAHLQVKMYKTPQRRTTFGSWDVEKVHAVVARSIFPSQNVRNTSASDLLRKLRCRKSARRCGAKHICKSKVQNTPFWDHFWKFRCRKSARRCGAKHISKSKVQKTEGYGALLDVQMCFRVAGARDCAPWQKWAKREGFVAFPKTLAGVGHLKRIFKDAFRVAGGVQKTCSSEMLGGQGADFLRGGAFWSIRSSGLLRWFCVTGAARRMTWHQYFRGRRSTLHRWSGKIAKRIGTRLPALHSTFHFWRKSHRIALSLTLLSSNIEEVLQNCCGFGRC